MKVLRSTLLLLSLVAGFSAHAALITIDANDHGWYTDSGEHNTGNPNVHTYSSGASYSTDLRRSFFNFDVTSLLGGSISSASVLFTADNGQFIPGSSPSSTLLVHDVNTLPGQSDTLSGDSLGIDIYDDLGTGVLYGSTLVTSTSPIPMPGLAVSLSSLSFADILADGFFSLGASTNDTARFWSSSNGTTVAAQLVVDWTPGSNANASIPEPSSLLMLALGLLGAGAMRRKA